MYLPLATASTCFHIPLSTFPSCSNACPLLTSPPLLLRFSSAFASALRLRASPPDGEDGSAAEKEAALIDAAFDMVESGSQNDEAVDALTAILSTTAPGSMAGALALSGIARCRVATGDITGAAELAEAITGEYAAHTMEPRVKHALSIVLVASDPSIAGVDVDALRSAVAADDNDLQAKHDLAAALTARLLYEEAIDLCLASIRKDKTFNEGAARVQILSIFEVLGAAANAASNANANAEVLGNATPGAPSSPEAELLKSARSRLTNLLLV